MSDLTTQLPERLGESGLLIPLLRLLADGEPVPVERLAEAAGRTIDEVRRGLAAVPDTEYDDQGRIVGQGLTLRPTPHRFTVDGEELYTWCALDTLIFPTLLDRKAHVESVSPASGEVIQVTIDPAVGVPRVDPPSVVVSLMNPEQITSIRSAFCNQVHYFTSVDDATSWLTAHPGAEVVPVAEAHQIGQELTTRLLDGHQDDAPAPSADACHRCC